MYLSEPYPKYIEYDEKGKNVRFRFKKYDAGWLFGWDETSKRNVYLTSYCYQYDDCLPKPANLKAFYYDVGGPELIGIDYNPEIHGV